MERLHKLFIYRKKLVRPYIEQLLKWMDIWPYQFLTINEKFM